MNDPSPRKRLLEAFTMKPSDRPTEGAHQRPPFWLMRQAGRYLPEYQRLRREAPDFLSFCYTPALCVEATLQPLRRYHMDGAILFSDILVIPDALGQRVRFIEGLGPRLDPLTGAADIARLELGRLDEHLASVFATVGALSTAIPPETTLIGFSGAPWTLALYMIEGQGGTGGEKVRALAWRDRRTFARLIAVLVDAVSHYLCRQIDHGAEVVQLFDSWAGLLAERQFYDWVIEPTTAIVRRIRAHAPAVPVIGFPRAAGVLADDYARLTGVDGIGLDAAVPAAWAASVLKPRCAIQGNLDNLVVVAGGVAMEREAGRVLDALAPSGRYIFNLGHGVLPETPPEHVARLAELIGSWGRS